MSIATDPLSLFFIGCFLFGLLFLVAVALLGSFGHGASANAAHSIHGSHIGHAPGIHGGASSLSHSHGIQGASIGGIHTNSASSGASHGNFSLFSYINPLSIALFALGFGFFGYVFHDAVDFVLPVAIVLSVVGGLVIAFLVLALLERVFGDGEGETIQDVSDRTGLIGKVSTTIQENGLGEVLYVSPGGMRKTVPARSSDGRRLERDQEVVVLQYAKGVAEVDTWENFINHGGSEEDVFGEEPDPAYMNSLRALIEEPESKNSSFIIKKDTQKE